MRFSKECPLNRQNLPSAEPALPVEVLLLGDLPGVPPRAHRCPCPDRRVELLGAGRRGVHDDPSPAIVGLGPRAESLLEAEQDLDRVARRLAPVVGARGGGAPARPRAISASSRCRRPSLVRSSRILLPSAMSPLPLSCTWCTRLSQANPHSECNRILRGGRPGTTYDDACGDMHHWRHHGRLQPS